MPYFTSWDANVFLCLRTFLPEEVVKSMINMVKKTNENFIKEEAMKYWSSLPSIPGRSYNPHHCHQELLRLWHWRAPEDRRNIIYEWISQSNTPIWGDTSEGGISRLKYDFDPFNGRYRIDSDKDLPIKGRYHSSVGLWPVWCIYDEKSRSQDKREYIANWYKEIHEGRYFLFFSENNINGYGKRGSKKHSVYEKISLYGSSFKMGPYEQMAEDLLVIDGPGLGKSGSRIDHINDLFS